MAERIYAPRPRLAPQRRVVYGVPGVTPTASLTLRRLVSRFYRRRREVVPDTRFVPSVVAAPAPTSLAVARRNDGQRGMLGKMRALRQRHRQAFSAPAPAPAKSLAGRPNEQTGYIGR